LYERQNIKLNDIFLQKIRKRRLARCVVDSFKEI